MSQHVEPILFQIADLRLNKLNPLNIDHCVEIYIWNDQFVYHIGISLWRDAKQLNLWAKAWIGNAESLFGVNKICKADLYDGDWLWQYVWFVVCQIRVCDARKVSLHNDLCHWSLVYDCSIPHQCHLVQLAMVIFQLTSIVLEKLAWFSGSQNACCVVAASVDERSMHDAWIRDAFRRFTAVGTMLMIACENVFHSEGAKGIGTHSSMHHVLAVFRFQIHRSPVRMVAVTRIWPLLNASHVARK